MWIAVPEFLKSRLSKFVISLPVAVIFIAIVFSQSFSEIWLTGYNGEA